MESKFGYLPDPGTWTDENGVTFDWFKKDKDFLSGLLPASKILMSGDVDLRPYATESNQHSLSSCAGNATADAIEILNDIEEKNRATLEGRAPRPPVQVSRLFIYSMARGMMDLDNNGEGDIDQDAGTYIRLCFEVLSRFGVCDETVWAYDESKVFTAPSLKAMRQAVGHRIHSYYRIRELGAARIDSIISALRMKHPVVFGTQIDADFQDPSGPTSVTVPGGPTVGGHAMIVVGYIDGEFIIKNSWGKFWREDGFCRMSPEYLMWSKTTDLWVPTLGTQFRR